MFVKQQDILNATNGGLDIITDYYPNANIVKQKPNESFKIRNEKTASARIKKLKDGNYVLTDFGGDRKTRNAIQVAMFEENISYKEAIIKLAEKYKVTSNVAPLVKSQAIFTNRPANADEKEGEYIFSVKENWTVREYKEIFPNYDEKQKERYNNVLKRFNVFALNSFTQIKNRKAFITESTPDYPIYMIEGDTFKKIYQPQNPEKKYRFRYTGTHTADYVYGLSQLRKRFELFKLQQEQQKAMEEEADSSQKEERTFTHEKLESVIIASGDRDALNVAEYGYEVIWLNSETATLTPSLFKELKKMCNSVYLLPDIDTTGVNAAIKTNLKYLDIKIIWLPEILKTFKDNRGYQRKDFKDYIEIYPKKTDFRTLYNYALPLKFWEETIKDKSLKYFFNNEQAYNFLAANGFKRIENKNNKDGFDFIRVKENIVEIIKPFTIKEFILNFLRKIHANVHLINMIHKTNQLSESSLAGLRLVDLDFTNFDENTQFLFFQNSTWEVTGKQIIEHKNKQSEKFVWDSKVVKHNVKRIAPSFTPIEKENGEYSIKVNHTESKFFSFLINGSRIYWQKELEQRAEEEYDNEQLEKYLKDNKFNIEGPLLDEEEKEIQRRHLINKCFVLGYLLHRYKDDPRSWCVFAMDDKISDEGESNGRSGKSYFFKFLKQILNSVTLSGRNPKLTENQHIYERVTEHTDLIVIDDSHQYLKFNFFFGDLTGPMTINPKNNKSYEIPFEKSPKFVITTNFTMRELDASTEDRLLYTVFSDYYHSQSDNTNYREVRKIYHDFDKTLHNNQYTEEEWNADFNFLADCLQFYLSVPNPIKINPPRRNITLRNLRTIMSDVFKNWADVYFEKDGEMVNELLPKHKVMEEFEKATKKKNWTTNKFTKALNAWAEYTPYVMAINPKDFQNSNGRIIRKFDGVSTEMLFVKTKDFDPEKLSEAIGNIIENEDKPF